MRETIERRLSLRMFRVLKELVDTEDASTIRGLSRRLGIHKPSITRAVDAFEELGLAKRFPDVIDRRSVNVRATIRGQKLVEKWTEYAAKPHAPHEKT